MRLWPQHVATVAHWRRRLIRPAMYCCRVIVVWLIAFSPASRVDAQSSLTGVWTFDSAASRIPRDVGFDASFLPRGPDQGGRRGPGGPLPFRPQSESFDVAQRRTVLTDEVRTPPARLTVVDSPDAVTVTDEHGRSRTFHPDGRAETLVIGGANVLTVARREDGTLVILYSVADLRQIRYSYARVDNPSRLLIDVQFVERGEGDSARLVYVTEGALEPSVPTRTAASAPPETPAVPAAPPAAMPRAGSEFTGLTRLGIVVEEPGSQAAACGLTRAGLEATAAGPFNDIGLRTSTNGDEDTYVHVTTMTSTLPTGMCITRYDWSIYSLTEATLSHQRTPLLAQVLLAHKGGLTGSMPAVHAADVTRGLTDGLQQIAGIIRDANR